MKPKPWPPRKSAEQLRALAIEIFERRVFHSQMLPAGDYLVYPMVFMPLGFLRGEALQQLKDNSRNIGLFYGYMKDAGPLSIGSFPTFTDMSLLHIKDLPPLQALLDKLKAAQDSVK